MPTLEAYRLAEQPCMKHMHRGIRVIMLGANLETGGGKEQKNGKEGPSEGWHSLV